MNMTVAAFVLKLMNSPVMEYYGLLHLPHSSSVLDLLKLSLPFLLNQLLTSTLYLCILSKS